MNQAAVAVDASVAVKWVVTAEDLSANAQALLRDCIRADRRIVGPPHVYGELANALYQRVRSRRPARHLTYEEAQDALKTFLALQVELVSPAGLYEQGFTFARTYSLPSLYDSLYVVLAQLLGTELWTADGRLLAALGTNAPWVRFIGAYPP